MDRNIEGRELCVVSAGFRPPARGLAFLGLLLLTSSAWSGRLADRICFSNLRTLDGAAGLYLTDHPGDRPLASLGAQGALKVIRDGGYLMQVPQCIRPSWGFLPTARAGYEIEVDIPCAGVPTYDIDPSGWFRCSAHGPQKGFEERKARARPAWVAPLELLGLSLWLMRSLGFMTLGLVVTWLVIRCRRYSSHVGAACRADARIP
ncbi:MAG: hypothetical protein HY815_08455 [Candidatus Riflebacteria bacterium]|nr:hypothetical protein [Candidatus Riflebacteria bacterium]